MGKNERLLKPFYVILLIAVNTDSSVLLAHKLNEKVYFSSFSSSSLDSPDSIKSLLVT